MTRSSHELGRGADTDRHETRLERTPRHCPSISTRRERSITQRGSHRIHVRSFRRRHGSGGLHAVLPGDRLCGRARAAASLTPPPVPSFTHFSSALTNKGRAQGQSRPRTNCAPCGTNATMRFETLTPARTKLARASPRSTGGRQRRVHVHVSLLSHALIRSPFTFS